MATFLAKTVEYATGEPLPESSGAFGDLGDNVHRTAIEQIAAGLVNGTGASTFCPADR